MPARLDPAGTRCPVCESSHVAPFLPGKFDPEQFALQRCSACGFIFARQRSGDRERHGHDYHQARFGLEHPVAAMSNAAEAIAFWSRRWHWTPATKLLDIGCADGRLLEAARSADLAATGIDISDFHASRWRERALQASVATPEALLASGAGPFDAIMTRQVIEHVADPVSFLRSCRTLLAPDGVCLVETGNTDSWQTRLLGEKWTYWVPGEGMGAHISFFNISSARKAGERAGLVLTDAVPSFRYRTLSAHALLKGTTSTSLRTIVTYWLHRLGFGGGVCYIFRAGADRRRMPPFNK